MHRSKTAIATAAAIAAVVLAPAAATAQPCAPGPETLCLLGGRLAVEVEWHDPRSGDSGTGGALPGSDRSGYFWFFRPDNVELVVKALDGGPVNGNLWVFYGALSDVEYTLRVTDTTSGLERTYSNPAGEICGNGDTTAFPAAAGAPPSAVAATPRPAPSRPVEPDRPAPVAAPLRVLSLPATGGTAPAAAGPCVPGPETLCLLGGRLAVEVDWLDRRSGDLGAGGVVPSAQASERSGFFWFFRPDNVELVVKALDGRSVNDRLWLFYGGLSDVEYWIRVTDTATGERLAYHNPPGEICGNGDTAAFCDDPASCRPAPERYWAATPVQASLADPRFYGFRDFDLAADVDAVSLHQDFYGVPWDAFAAGADPPAAWVAEMDGIAAQAAAWGKPVYLSLAIVGGPGRAYLAPRVVPGATPLATEGEWSERCFDFASHPDGPRWRRAYLAYVRWMVERFHPDWLTHGIEVNLFQTACDATDPGAWDALAAVLDDAYAAAKEIDPELPVFPSFQIDFFTDQGAGGACHDTDPTPCILRALSRNQPLERDRFAISSYPHLVEAGGVELDYAATFDAVLSRIAGEPIAVAETGYASLPLVVELSEPGPPQCVTVAPYDDARQRAYFDALAAAAERWDMDLVTWWSARDVLPASAATSCPCADPEGSCAVLEILEEIFGDFEGELLFKAFAAMGLRDWYGAPKPLLGRWNEVRGGAAAATAAAPHPR